MKTQKKLISANQLNMEELTQELERVKYRKRFNKVFRSTIYSLIIVASISVLVATLWMPVLQIFGSSMSPTLQEGEVVIALKSKDYEHGDIIAFYYNNKVLVKRVIAGPGDWVEIDEDGNVAVNNIPLQEDYVMDKARGDCDIQMPYQVPDSRFFVMGDHRTVSLDSRKAVMGCVAEEQIVGKLQLRIWPLSKIQLIR